jgi:RNA polymerase sigma factor (sigma-70 family)
VGRDEKPTAHRTGTARDEVRRLLAERGDHLMRAAIALAGSRADGEDLLQAALERLLRRWHRVESDPQGYLRRTLYNMAADGWRRRGAWLRKLPLLQADRNPAPGTDAVEAVDLRDAIGRTLAQLPPGQRTVLALRYWEGFSRVPAPKFVIPGVFLPGRHQPEP